MSPQLQAKTTTKTNTKTLENQRKSALKPQKTIENRNKTPETRQKPSTLCPVTRLYSGRTLTLTTPANGVLSEAKVKMPKSRPQLTKQRQSYQPQNQLPVLSLVVF